jgi:hypothetical protein
MNPMRSASVNSDLVEIEMTAHGRGEVRINGQKVPCVSAVCFEASVNCESKVTIVLSAPRVKIKGPAEIVTTEADPL